MRKSDLANGTKGRETYHKHKIQMSFCHPRGECVYFLPRWSLGWRFDEIWLKIEPGLAEVKLRMGSCVEFGYSPETETI